MDDISATRAIAPKENELLHQANTVGDMLMRLIGHNGDLVKTGLENCVISMSLEQL